MPSRHLSLWKQALGVVPDAVWDRADLETLVLADNDLTEISDRVGELRHLRMLDLGHNRLRRIPRAWGSSSSSVISSICTTTGFRHCRRRSAASAACAI